MGYFTLSELLSVKWHGILGIERDLHFEPVKVAECTKINPRRYRRDYVDPAQVTMGKEE